LLFFTNYTWKFSLVKTIPFTPPTELSDLFFPYLHLYQTITGARTAKGDQQCLFSKKLNSLLRENPLDLPNPVFALADKTKFYDFSKVSASPY
jgi:hypothetical protein